MLSACTNQPKVIVAETATKDSPLEFSDLPESHKISFDQEDKVPSNVFHKVVVQEVLPTSKYVYLKVTEGTKAYWIATKKMEVKPKYILLSKRLTQDQL